MMMMVISIMALQDLSLPVRGWQDLSLPVHGF